ncbi:hypothetical protein ACFVFS_15350 [Kitasatospora sp. NPDC057692]
MQVLGRDFPAEHLCGHRTCHAMAAANCRLALSPQDTIAALQKKLEEIS